MAPSPTTSGALKQYIEGLGLELAGFRDRAPNADTPLPYVRVTEAISITPRRSGDFGDPGAAVQVTEEVQLDLFQQWKVSLEDKTVVEDFTLAERLVRRLHGADLSGVYTKRVYGVRVLTSTRLLNEEKNEVRQLITVALDRAL